MDAWDSSQWNHIILECFKWVGLKDAIPIVNGIKSEP